MRVSDAFVFSSLNKRINAARVEVANAQEKAASGLRVSKPSDDPVAFAAAQRERSKQALAESGMKAGDLAHAQLSGADEALATATDAVAYARELAVQGASGALGADQRKALVAQVRQIRDQMVALGNTQVADSFVFGGYRDGTPPFDANGQFTGDSTVKEVTTYPGIKVSASLPAEEAFGSAGNGDVFSTLDALANALENDDQEAVRATIGDLATSESRMITARSRVGAMMDGVQTAHAVADRYGYSAELEATRLTGADEVAAITDLLKAKSALDAALATAQQLPTGGLIKRG